MNIKKEIPTYYFSEIKYKDLRKIVTLERCFDQAVFNVWFSANIQLKVEEVKFLDTLLNRQINLIKIYKEEDLKIHFISPILNHINFLSFKNKMRDFYEEKICYKTKDFILRGMTDFMVAKGLEYAEKPYFFIQEFKKEIGYHNPEPQLLAELISALELNKVKIIKGAYIVGAIWNFVIVKKISKHHYKYYVSRNYDSTDLSKLKSIYKNLLFIKQEIIKQVSISC